MKAAEKVVAYFYDEDIGNFCYGGGNPMRPHRARMCYTLVDSYGLTKKMMVQRPRPREFQELTSFHADDYINFLRAVTPNTVDENMTQLRRFNMGIAGEADCPVFDGMYEYCQMYAGGSVDGAAQLAAGNAQVAFNWSGGMHHAKKAEASGFCYVNDIVMAILELLKTFQRVLYVDIDIHHGDGVEEAFYLTDRVMTVSFHKYGEFFPGTGALDDIGYGKGKHYTVNVPLKDGMDDESYRMVYEPIMQKVMEMYQPGAIVMCCGADSLSGDRLGCFNLSLEGHSNCLEFLAKFNVPMIILGGGGYTLRNVARCWCYETGRMQGIDLPDVLPESALEDFNMYLDTQRLRIAVSNMKNANEKAELEKIKVAVLEHLSRLPPVPSAHMAYVPPRLGREKAEEGLPEEDPDVRGGGQLHEEARRVRDGEESDGEEGSGRGGFGDDPSAPRGGKVLHRYGPDGGSGGGGGPAGDQDVKPPVHVKTEPSVHIKTEPQQQPQGVPPPLPQQQQQQQQAPQQPEVAAAGAAEAAGRAPGSAPGSGGGAASPAVAAPGAPGPAAGGAGSGSGGGAAAAAPGVGPAPAVATAGGAAAAAAAAAQQQQRLVQLQLPATPEAMGAALQAAMAAAAAQQQQQQQMAAAAAAAAAAGAGIQQQQQLQQQQPAVRMESHPESSGAGAGPGGFPTANGGFGAAPADGAAGGVARMQTDPPAASAADVAAAAAAAQQQQQQQQAAAAAAAAEYARSALPYTTFPFGNLQQQ